MGLGDAFPPVRHRPLDPAVEFAAFNESPRRTSSAWHRFCIIESEAHRFAVFNMIESRSIRTGGACTRPSVMAGL